MEEELWYWKINTVVELLTSIDSNLSPGESLNYEKSAITQTPVLSIDLKQGESI